MQRCITARKQVIEYKVHTPSSILWTQLLRGGGMHRSFVYEISILLALLIRGTPLEIFTSPYLNKSSEELFFIPRAHI